MATVGGALRGGAVGYVIGKGSSPGKKRRGMLGGAAVGGVIGSKAAGGSNTAYEYAVALASGERVAIVTEQGGIDAGDCVAVDRGASANIRRVSEVHCQTPDGQPSPEHVVEAQQCEAAKAALLDAETSAALEAAVRRARRLCEE